MHTVSLDGYFFGKHVFHGPSLTHPVSLLTWILCVSGRTKNKSTDDDGTEVDVKGRLLLYK